MELRSQEPKTTWKEELRGNFTGNGIGQLNQYLVN